MTNVRVVLQFESALARNRGRLAGPQSDLPCSRDQLRQALLENASIEARNGRLSAERREFYKSALIELESFLPDPDAAFLRTRSRRRCLAAG